jgi:hypothetical protein
MCYSHCSCSDEDRLINLDAVLRSVRRHPSTSIRDGETIQMFLYKLPPKQKNVLRSLNLATPDISFLASLVKSLPDSAILDFIYETSFHHPEIDTYNSRHPKERVKLFGRDTASTVSSLHILLIAYPF